MSKITKFLKISQIFSACWNALNLSANRVIVSETGSKCCLDGYIDQILEG